MQHPLGHGSGMEFRHHDILAWVEEHRSELLSLLLTMVRAWIVAGKPKGIAPKIGSFVKWSEVIGGILTYAGVEGFLGNAAELYDSADQDIAQWDLFLFEWQKLHRDDKITAAQLKIELTDLQSIYKQFQNEMPDDVIKATDKGSRGASVLGQTLRRHADQVFPSGRKLTVVQDSHTKAMKWSVITILRSAEDQKAHESQASSPFAEDAEDGSTPSPNQKENIPGIEKRGENSKIIPERNGGGGESSSASSAKKALDSENGILASSANMPEMIRVAALTEYGMYGWVDSAKLSHALKLPLPEVEAWLQSNYVAYERPNGGGIGYRQRRAGEGAKA